MNRLGVSLSHDRPLFGLMVRCMVGLSWVAFILGLCSFLLPVNAYIGAVLVVGSAALFVDGRIRADLSSAISGLINWPLAAKAVGVLLFLMILIISAGPSLNYDTGLYHVPFINWIQTFPVVPGLANLHGRFGFNSHWHLLEAALNGAPFLQIPFNDLGGLFTLLLVISSVESIVAIQRSNNTFLDLILALFIVPIYLLFRFLTSDSPDLPNAIFGFAVLCLVWAEGLDTRSKLLSMVMVGTLLVTFKVTAVFLLLAAFPYFILASMRTRLLSVALGIILIGPWLGRNVVQTGYLVFPAKFTAVGNPDYRVPEADMDHMDKLLKAHGRHGTYAVERIDEPTSVWFMEWFNMQTRVIQIILILSVLLSIILSARFAWEIIKGGFKNSSFNHLSLQVIMIISLIVWFAKGPNPRYIYGILIFYSAYLLSLAVMRTSKQLLWVFLVVGTLLSMNLFRIVLKEEPAPFDTPTLMSIESGDALVMRPIGTDQCADAALPCASIDVVGLEPRGKDLSDGFRIEGR